MCCGDLDYKDEIGFEVSVVENLLIGGFFKMYPTGPDISRSLIGDAPTILGLQCSAFQAHPLRTRNRSAPVMPMSTRFLRNAN